MATRGKLLLFNGSKSSTGDFSLEWFIFDDGVRRIFTIVYYQIEKLGLALTKEQ